MIEEFEIRNSRNGSWYWVNTAVNACKHISAYDKCVYGALCSFDGCKEIRPSFELISERSNVSAREAKRSIKKLVEVGYVEIIKGGGRGRANIYNLLKCVYGCKECLAGTVLEIKGVQQAPETVPMASIKGVQQAHQIDKELNKKEKKILSRFTPPSLLEVSNYCQERKNSINPQNFIDFYESKGWMVGKNKMKKWQASVRVWENRNKPIIKTEIRNVSYEQVKQLKQKNGLSN